jgi:SNF2 family DNA or RNA helicase
MEMRLGKTLVAIRTIKLYQPRSSDKGLRVLVVAPSTVLGTWEDELRQDGEADIAYLVGERQQRHEALSEGHRWCLVNKEGHLAIGDALAAYPWDAVVLDEHFIKNPKAQVTRHHLQGFRGVPHRWWLTGTPMPESELDVVCPMLYLDGHYLGHRSFWSFRARNCTQFMYDWMMKPGVRERMLGHLGKRAFILRREDVGLDQLKIYQKRVFTMSAELRKAYDTLEEEWLVEHGGQVQAQTQWRTVQQVWLRRMCGGFVPNDQEPPSPQADYVWDAKAREVVWLMQGELKGQRVVVWAAFNDELAACADALRAANIPHNILVGDTKVMVRAEIIQKFRNGEFPVLLCQVELAKYGINLGTASAAIYYSTPLGNETRQQSEDRIVVAGSQKAVLIIDFVVRDTVDWDIYDMVVLKKEASVTASKLAQAIEQRRHGRDR